MCLCRTILNKREYSYLKMIFRLCIREIISKLLFMQEPTNIYYITKKTTIVIHDDKIMLLTPLEYPGNGDIP